MLAEKLQRPLERLVRRRRVVAWAIRAIETVARRIEVVFALRERGADLLEEVAEGDKPVEQAVSSDLPVSNETIVEAQALRDALERQTLGTARASAPETIAGLSPASPPRRTEADRLAHAVTAGRIVGRPARGR